MERIRWFLAAVLALLGATQACNLPGIQPRRDHESATRAALAAELFPDNPNLFSTAAATPQEVFPGLRTATPFGAMGPTASETLPPVPPGYQLYYARSGDTIQALARRFEVTASSIVSTGNLAEDALLPPRLPVFIPESNEGAGFSDALLPDSEVIFSSSASEFNMEAFTRLQGGYLAGYREQLGENWISASQIVNQVSRENSINPRLLLAIIDFRTGWLSGQPAAGQSQKYPLGFQIESHQGLYRELSLAVRHLTTGYYGWRAGSLARVVTTDKQAVRLHPALNAGSAALYNLFSQVYSAGSLPMVLSGPQGFLVQYSSLFGDPWSRAAQVEPIFPAGLEVPALELPFLSGHRWSLTGGPHSAWGVGGPMGALDFAPSAGQPGCSTAPQFATAAAAGLVVRSGNGVVAVDLDGDGDEQTGWVLIYLHLAAQDRVAAGAWVARDDPLGHPSCEGGIASGTHVHISRKYNGEWIPISPATPMILSGWRAVPGERAYQSSLVRGGDVIIARSDGSHESVLERNP